MPFKLIIYILNYEEGMHIEYRLLFNKSHTLSRRVRKGKRRLLRNRPRIFQSIRWPYNISDTSALRVYLSESECVYNLSSTLCTSSSCLLDQNHNPWSDFIPYHSIMLRVTIRSYLMKMAGLCMKIYIQACTLLQMVTRLFHIT